MAEQRVRMFLPPSFRALPQASHPQKSAGQPSADDVPSSVTFIRPPSPSIALHMLLFLNKPCGHIHAKIVPGNIIRAAAMPVKLIDNTVYVNYLTRSASSLQTPYDRVPVSHACHLFATGNPRPAHTCAHSASIESHYPPQCRGNQGIGEA